MKNREKLNQMSNEELAELLSNMPCSYCVTYDYCHTQEVDNEEYDCNEVIKKWLESEIEDGQ